MSNKEFIEELEMLVEKLEYSLRMFEPEFEIKRLYEVQIETLNLQIEYFSGIQSLSM